MLRALSACAAAALFVSFTATAAADDAALADALRHADAVLAHSSAMSPPREPTPGRLGPTPQPSAAPADRFPERDWAVGLRSGYTTIPNAVLGAIFARYKPINGWFLEGVAVRKWRGFRIYASMTGTRAQADTGVWQRGPTKTPNEVSIDVGFFSMDAVFDWEVRLHKRFAFHFGAGLGIGFLFGTISSKECANLAGACIYLPNAPTRDRKAEDGWPLYPVLHLVAGTRIDLIDRLSLRVDFDFRNAFGFGLGLFWEI